jgi:hypothetical protein
MKVVKRKSDGKIVYRSSPEFEEGFGIKNAVVLDGGLHEDYEEVAITEQEWLVKVVTPRQKEEEIQAEMNRLLREQAIINLEDLSFETKLTLSNPIEDLEVKGYKSKHIYEGGE